MTGQVHVNNDRILDFCNESSKTFIILLRTGTDFSTSCNMPAV